jgi:hypothetical protein
MITVFGEGRRFRLVWLLEEMGLAYRLRPVDLLAGVQEDAEFLAINPAGSSRRSRGRPVCVASPPAAGRRLASIR